MPRCQLLVKDQVNVKFQELDPTMRRKLSDALKFMVPGARHMPQYKLGRWDGTVSFCSIGGSTYLNLIDRLLSILYEKGYEIDVEDHRPFHSFTFPQITEDMFAHKTWPEGHVVAGEPIILRDYQVEAIKTYTENLQGVQEISTGAGKTIITAALSSLVEPYGRSIVIVPSKDLVNQTEEDYVNLGLDVGVFFGDRKEWGRKHTICTWQSLSVFAKKSKGDEVIIPIEKFLKDVICVMVDEAHAAKGKELKELLCGPFAEVPIRWGLTGTIPLEEHEAICLLASIGPKVGEIRASELQEKGVLADCRVEINQFNDDHVEFDDYETEHKFLVTDPTRLKHIADLVQFWSEDGSTLVLVDRIEAGEALKALIPNSVFIHGVVKSKKRKEEYKSIQTTDNKIIIATYGVASTGINIPRIFNLVLLEPGKSFVRVIQSIGRGLRKAHDKEFIRIIDLCSSLKFSKRHLTKRKAYYSKAEYPFIMHKIKYL